MGRYSGQTDPRSTTFKKCPISFETQNLKPNVKFCGLTLRKGPRSVYTRDHEMSTDVNRWNSLRLILTHSMYINSVFKKKSDLILLKIDIKNGLTNHENRSVKWKMMITFRFTKRFLKIIVYFYIVQLFKIAHFGQLKNLHLMDTLLCFLVTYKKQK